MRVGRLKAGLIAAAAMAAATPAAAQADTWEPVKGTPPAAGAQVDADRLKAFTLDLAQLKGELAGAQKAARAAAGGTVLTVPAPDGTLQRFAVHETSIMEPGLAAKHPNLCSGARCPVGLLSFQRPGCPA